MKKLLAYIFLFSAAAGTVSAQKKLSRKAVYSEWEATPALHPVPGEYKNEPAFYVINNVEMDYRYEGRSMNLYYTLHRIIKVLDNKGIESYNKVIIPVSRNTRVPLIRARTILPNGKVYEVAKEMMKVTKDESGRNTVVIAMEGVERNAEIELLVKQIRPGSMFGDIDFQYNVPVQNTVFELSSPADIPFEEKGYNGFPDAESVIENNRQHITITKENIPAMRPEPHGYSNLYSMRAEYRVKNFIDKNENDNKQIYTWDDLGKTLYNNHCKITEKERTAVNKYLTSLGVAGRGDEGDNIRKIEDGIKNNIVLYAYLEGDKTDDLDSIISKRSATENGYIKLFAACLTQAGVKNELGITTDRTEHVFDSKFVNWGNMEHYVFYFPNLKRFLAPASIYTRYPFVPDELLTTKGVFCTIPPDGFVTGGLCEIKTISPLPASESRRNITAKVNFSNDMNAAVDATYSYSGYPAAELREELALLPKEKTKDWIKKLVQSEKAEDINKYTISNEGFEHLYSNKPLEINASMNTPQLVEHAGSKYLFKLGDVIGDQGELYSEKERVMPVDLSYPYSLNRTITIKIPKGYKVLNPESIRINADYTDKNVKPVIGFKSDYVLKTDKVNGDALIITVSEFYSQIHFSTQEYQQYRKVFNAAADFNKVTLIMDKKKA
ncbi:MAG: hypothetical protein JWQ38_3072 [Flavipsychrobacter sp.]|nr:hypothetical protein [Flavipsychrobacter sp.]